MVLYPESYTTQMTNGWRFFPICSQQHLYKTTTPCWCKPTRTIHHQLSPTSLWRLIAQSLNHPSLTTSVILLLLCSPDSVPESPPTIINSSLPQMQQKTNSTFLANSVLIIDSINFHQSAWVLLHQSPIQQWQHHHWHFKLHFERDPIFTTLSIIS